MNLVGDDYDIEDIPHIYTQLWWETTGHKLQGDIMTNRYYSCDRCGATNCGYLGCENCDDVEAAIKEEEKALDQ